MAARTKPRKTKRRHRTYRTDTVPGDMRVRTCHNEVPCARDREGETRDRSSIRFLSSFSEDNVEKQKRKFRK